MKVLQTKFDGHHFRSRLEARWAVFFKELEIPTLYGMEGFDLGVAGYYLPDFFLPGIPSRNYKGQKGIWIEIKPCPPDLTYRRKLYALAEDTLISVILLIGAVSPGCKLDGEWGEEYEEYMPHKWNDGCVTVVNDQGMVWCKCDNCGKIKMDWGNGYSYCYACGGISTAGHPSITAAVSAALSERFGT